MDDIAPALVELREAGLYREMRTVEGAHDTHIFCDGRPVLCLCSNNYLGLAAHPTVREASAEAAMRLGAGAGASRLVSGNMALHTELESRLSEFKRKEACVLFGSGYLANTGTIAALCTQGQTIFSDALNHASIIDGCRLSKAKTFVYRHADTEHLEWGLRHTRGRGGLIVTDGVFSMDGDIADLEAIVDLARRHGVGVCVDEAHATGTIGPGGRGSVASLGLEGEVDVVIGTLSKALGSYGAYVLCTDELASYLQNTARTLIFSTALPPPVVAAACAALEILQTQPKLVDDLRENARVLRDALATEGVASPGETPIISMHIGAADQAVLASQAAFERGVFCQAIRPPTVPEGTSRLRLTPIASHSHNSLRAGAGVLAQARRAALEAGPVPALANL